MAIKLVTEVMDWAPPLTHREHKVLMILAENARLPSRETWAAARKEDQHDRSERAARR
jgi:hypothetical protein